MMEEFDYGVYSGYIPVGENDYHYMFTESQGNPETDPLVIWFNGGPGCSSMLGFAQEIGPWKMDDEDTKFYKNEYSWNKFANLLFIESPAGVGYSKCKTTESCIWNDDNSAEDNY
jgi:cathepsin A (carboxypeptidase C)